MTVPTPIFRLQHPYGLAAVTPLREEPDSFLFSDASLWYNISVDPLSNSYNTPNTPHPLGVIDTLSAGIFVMIQNPWLLLLPVLFDLFYWFAPPLILGPELIAILLTPFDPQGANATLLATRPELTSDISLLYDNLRRVASGINLWQFLVSSFLFWPSALAVQVPDAETISVMQEQGWQLTYFGDVALSLIGLTLMGLFVNVFWLHGIAYSVQKKENAHLIKNSGKKLSDLAKRPSGLGQGNAKLLIKYESGFDNVRSFLHKTVQHGLRLLIMGVILITIFFATLFPLSFVLALIMLLLPGVGACLYSIAIVATLWLLFWLAIHLYFTVAAVIMADQSLLQAPWLSIQMVRRFFRSGIAFILLCTLLSWGFQVVWNGLSHSDIGRLLTVIGNSALGTAIAAGMMIFFEQRYQIFMEEKKKK